MEEVSKTLKILLKRTETLDSMNNSLINLENKVNTLSANIEKRMVKLENTVTDLERAANASEKSVSDIKRTSTTLLQRDTVREGECKQLQERVKGLENKIEQEQISRNQLAQYHRSSVYVVIVGVPLQRSEQPSTDPRSAGDSASNSTRAFANDRPVLDIINKVATKAKITGYSENDIDVAHRLPAKKGNPSIIVRFKTKRARTNFYQQRSKLRGITAESLGREGNMDTEVSFGKTESKLFILESLTPLNGELLKEAKTIAKPRGYEFFGYTFNGEVRVKKNRSSNFIPIRCRNDLENII